MEEEKIIESVRGCSCLWQGYKDIKAKENAGRLFAVSPTTYFSTFVFASCGERLVAKLFRDCRRLRSLWLSRVKWMEFSNHETYWITYLLYTSKFMNSTTQRKAAQRKAAQRNHRNATQLLASYCELGFRPSPSLRPCTKHLLQIYSK